MIFRSEHGVLNNTDNHDHIFTPNQVCVHPCNICPCDSIYHTNGMACFRCIWQDYEEVCSSWILGCVFLVQWSQSGADNLDSLVEDLLPHPTGRRWAGSQPSFAPSESGGSSCRLERGEFGEVVEQEVQEYLEQHYTSAKEKAEPGMLDVELPGRWPWLSLPLNLEVDGDPQQPGNQAEMAQRQMKLREMRGVKAWHRPARPQA